MDKEKLGEMVYIDILNRANDYVFIMTPYLILDGEMESALKFTAQRGVDVRIILPGIPDKKIPYALAKTHYKSLLSSGRAICFRISSVRTQPVPMPLVMPPMGTQRSL